MKKKIIERRKSRRTFFVLEDHVLANVILPEANRDPVPVNLLSLSRGGLSFVGDRQDLETIRQFDRLELTDIESPNPVGHIQNVTIEVRYIIDFDIFSKILLGGQFIEISDRFLNRIEKLVDDRCEIARR